MWRRRGKSGRIEVEIDSEQVFDSLREKTAAVNQRRKCAVDPIKEENPEGAREAHKDDGLVKGR